MKFTSSDLPYNNPLHGTLRVIYFTRTAEEEIVLLIMYAKAKTDNITGQKLKEIRRAIEN